MKKPSTKSRAPKPYQPLKWCDKYDLDAQEEGWILANLEGTGILSIQRRDDTVVFDSDAMALAYVFDMASYGSRLHVLAIKAIAASLKVGRGAYSP